jgi:hypothetical protein
MRGNFGTNWTDEAIAVAKKYNDEGLSRTDIADKIAEETGLKFSRNAVIGKLARLGVKCTNPPRKCIRVSRPRRAVASPAVMVARRERQHTNAKLFGPSIHEPGESAVSFRSQPKTGMRYAVGECSALAPLNIPFLDRKDGECAFICSGDGEPTTVCGHAQMPLFGGKEEKSSYCPFHHGVTHQGYAVQTRHALQGEAA